MSLTLEQCEVIYNRVVHANACKGNIEAAKRYLDAGDTEGFERVCRGNYAWLRNKSIEYALTDGPAEMWHTNGQLSSRGTYDRGELQE